MLHEDGEQFGHDSSYGPKGGVTSPRESLPAENVREHERRNDRRVALDHVTGRIDSQLAPGDLLVRHRAGVRAVARRRIADLAKVAPQRNVGALQILMKHRHDADRKIAGNAAADLEE